MVLAAHNNNSGWRTKRKLTETITERCFSCQKKSVCQKLARSCQKLKIDQNSIYALFARRPSIHNIMWKPNSIIVLLYIFHIPVIHPGKQKQSIQPFCFWGEHSKGLSNQADVELDMINAIAAADIAFIMSSSQAIVNWLNALHQSDFS